MMDYRIGHGFDVHRLVADRKLILCGVEIPAELGLLGHSDADVATHALMDALLGTLALGDIGGYFPDTDPRWSGADSLVLLEEVLRLPAFTGWRLVNCDLTIVAQHPRLSPFRDRMRQRLADVLGVVPERISVKATTTEGLGFAGRGEGIAADCTVLLGRAD